MSIQGFAQLFPSNDGSLQKLRILHEVDKSDAFTGEVQALFNPGQLRYSQSIDWQSNVSPGQQVSGVSRTYEFRSTGPVTLTLDLFFDTYEGDPQSASSLGLGRLKGLATAMLPSSPFSTAPPSASPVLSHTRKLVALSQVAKELHRPPVCKLWWGRFLLLRGVLTQLGEEYSFFLPNGTPVRANFSCTFMEIQDRAALLAAELHSADVEKMRVVRRGDTLSSIAFDEYGDPSLWRPIALANGIDDPRHLTPGQRLAIPVLPK